MDVGTILTAAELAKLLKATLDWHAKCVPTILLYRYPAPSPKAGAELVSIGNRPLFRYHSGTREKSAFIHAHEFAMSKPDTAGRI